MECAPRIVPRDSPVLWYNLPMSSESIDKQYEQVVNAPPEMERREFGRFCRLVIDAVDRGELTIQEGTYRICGTAARILDVLSADEREIMTIAGNLELPEAQRDQTLPDWDGLKRKMSTLFANE